MEGQEKKKKKTTITVESADTACGGVPHMTVDQLAALLKIESRELRCPACGRVHLTDEDVREAEALRYSTSERFKKIKEEAEGSAG